MAAATGYDVRAVPSNPRGSRWFLPSSPGGNGVVPAENLGRVAHSLAGEIKSGMTTAAPPMVEVEFQAVCRLRDGSYELRPRGSVILQQAFVSERPGRIWQKAEGPAMLDDFLMRGEAFEKAPDREIWAALLSTVAAHSLDGEGNRLLQDAVSVALAARAGISVTAFDLPHPELSE